jgi:exonuclease VII small subunit
MLTALQSHSQDILTQENRVKTFIDQKGDTMISMHYEDARILLEDVLNYQYTDSILTLYKQKDSLNNEQIVMYKETLVSLTTKVENLETMNNNLDSVIVNYEKEIEYKDDTIKQQKQEIIKQKTLKLVGFAGSIILPILTLLLLN